MTGSTPASSATRNEGEMFASGAAQSAQILAASDENGCYGWPRVCEHFDDLICMLAEMESDQAFQRYFARAGRRHDQGHGMPASVKPSLHRRGWRRG